MMKKGYKLVSTEEIKPFASFDKNNFGGKQMWEERLSNLDTLFGKLFRVLVITSVLAYVVFIISFIYGLALLKGGEGINQFIISSLIQIGIITIVIVASFISTEIITHYIKSKEIFYANMIIKEADNVKEVREEDIC